MDQRLLGKAILGEIITVRLRVLEETSELGDHSLGSLSGYG